MAYTLEGRLLEVCDCKTLCPCWVGEDPDNGTCKGVLAWHVDKGKAKGVDVSGISLCAVCDIPGNILNGNWRAVVYVDSKASDEQTQALLDVFTGKEGGPIADFAKLIGEVVGVERVPMTFEVEKGKGSLRIGNAVAADLAPFRGPDESPTALTNSIFSTIPGSPAYVGKASLYKANVPQLGIELNISGHNAVQGEFRFAG